MFGFYSRLFKPYSDRIGLYPQNFGDFSNGQSFHAHIIGFYQKKLKNQRYMPKGF
jgi:hypothetical protein